MIRTTTTLLGIIILMKFIISLVDVTESGVQETEAGAFWTGQYPNLFTDLLGISADEVNARIDHYWEQLFYGDDENERVYYPTNQNMA